MNDIRLLLAVLMPMIGTGIGAAMVFFIRTGKYVWIEKALLGFAAGVMTAASVWSLLIPSMEMADNNGQNPAITATAGLLAGVLILMVIDRVVERLRSGKRTGHNCSMLILAVTLHNIPEGMAVGVAVAAAMAGSGEVTAAGAFALSLGVAIQNIPEGAVISMPVAAGGTKRGKAFWSGLLSGVVEPIGSLLTIALTACIASILPSILAFAAGAMIFVVVEELIPEAQEGGRSNAGTLGAGIGFAVMMLLDVVLG